MQIASALDPVFDLLPTYPMWLIGTIGLDLYIPDPVFRPPRSRRFSRLEQPWRRVFHAGVLIEPHLPELEEFKKYFDHSIKVRITGLLNCEMLKQLYAMGKLCPYLKAVRESNIVYNLEQQIPA